MKVALDITKAVIHALVLPSQLLKNLVSLDDIPKSIIFLVSVNESFRCFLGGSLFVE